MSGRSVLVSGLGLCCALGAGAGASQAAYAASARPFRRERAVVGVDGLPTTLCSALPFPSATGFPERLAELFAGALADLVGAGTVAGVPFYVMLPEWLDGHPDRDRVARSLEAAAAGPGGAAPCLALLHGGAAEALALVGQAAASVQAGAAEDVVVGAVDSFLHPALLDRMAASGRTVHSRNPYGAVPGEAACLVRLSADTAGPALGTVLAMFRGTEPEPPDRPAAIIGRGLAKAFRDTAAHAEPERLLSDMNGERWRSEEFGFAVSAAGGPFPALSDRVEVPAMHLGDCGAAAGPAMLALAMGRAPRRTHAEDGTLALLAASSFGGLRTALVAERFDGEAGAGPQVAP